MKTDQQRQIKKQTHRLNYLKEELVDVSSAAADGSRAINLAVFEFFARANKRILLNPDAKKQDQAQQDDDLNDESASQDPEVKKIFRKIAIKTHPDKLDKSDPDYDTLTSVYIDASKAAAANNFDELIQIAINLEIPVDFDYEIQIRAIEKISQKIESEINEFKKGIGYTWSMTDDDKVKKALLCNVIQNLNEQPDESLVEDVIAWLKSGASGGTSYVSRDPNRPVTLDARRPGTRPQKRTRD